MSINSMIFQNAGELTYKMSKFHIKQSIFNLPLIFMIVAILNDSIYFKTVKKNTV